MKPQRAEADSVLEKLPMWMTRSSPSKAASRGAGVVLEIGEDVVLDDGQAELVGELQHAVGDDRRQRRAGRVVDARNW